MKNLKPVLIVENCLSGLQKEQASFERKDYILSGIFTEFNVKNRNDRIYTANKFLPHLQELLERKKNLGVVYGEFDHPDVFDTSLKRISHTIESAVFNSEKNIVTGSIRLLNTQWGKEAKALVDDGCPIFVSSRAAGITESNGEVTIKKLFTYDAVADPGFASARVALNESLGFNESVNFRIYEVTDESKINQLFNMNENDMITKKEMQEYSSYLTNEMQKISDELSKAIKEGKVEPEKIQELAEYYSNLNDAFNKVSGYLDYLAENIQILVNENKDLKLKTDNLVKHNDYLVENINKSIKYSEYLAEKLDKTIDYSEYIAETLSNSIDFSEYVAEHVDKNIRYSEYLAEKLDNTIVYSEYIAENLDKSIDFSNYLAENLDNNIAYSEYIAENLDNNIAYSEYLAENLDNSIKYGEYIAEHVDNSIAYSEYIAENLSDTQAYSKYISESLDKTISYVKGVKINEGVDTPDERIGNLKVDNIDVYYQEEIVDDNNPIQVQDDTVVSTTDTNDGDAVVVNNGDVQPTDSDVQPVQVDGDTQPVQQPDAVNVQPVQQPVDNNIQPVSTLNATIIPGMTVKLNDDSEGEVIATNPQNGIVVVKTITDEVKEVQESCVVKILGDKLIESQGQILNNIKELIAETKKRKASEEKEPHFLLFMSESNKSNFLNLSDEDKEKVIVAMNESKYTTEAEVLKIMQKALIAGQKSFNETLVEKLPVSLKPVWENLNAKIQNGILAQAKLYNLNTDEKIESFWNSRGLTELTATNEKKPINESLRFVDNSNLTDTEIDRYISVIKNLR